MKRKLSGFLLVAMFVLSFGWNPAWAANWVFLRNSSGADIYLDTASIDDSLAPEMDFTVKYIFQSEQVHEGLQYREQLHYMSINCQTRYAEQLGLSILDGNGQVARSWHVYDGDQFDPPAYVPPGSYGDQEIAIVCVP